MRSIRGRCARVWGSRGAVFVLVTLHLVLASATALPSATGIKARVQAIHARGASTGARTAHSHITSHAANVDRARGPTKVAASSAHAADHAPTGHMHNILEKLKVRAVKQQPQSDIVVQPDRLTMERSGEWFTVSWSGVPEPRYDDWIALVVPADANLSATAPAKWKYAAGDPRHIEEGAGSLRFRLISYRADVAFALMRNGFEAAVEVARSEPIRLLAPNEPLQVHLALTGRQGEMRVQWNTRDAGERPQVRWGRHAVEYTGGPGAAAAADAGGGGGGGAVGGGGGGGAGAEGGGSLRGRGRRDGGPAYPHAADAGSSRYGREDMCGEPATSIGWVDAGTHHVALMAGLKPSTRYYYRVGDPAYGWSPEFSFLTGPAPSPAASVRVLAMADVGQAEVDGSLEGSEMLPSLNTTALMAADLAAGGYSLLLHNGDISYARGYSTQWDNFLSQLQPLAAVLPYMLAPGNHERDWPGSGGPWDVTDSGGECGVPYERRFPMPYPGRDKQWYAFEHGPAFFLQYSTEHDFAPGSEQYDFIAKTLASVDRARTPWLVLGGHRPIYISSSNTEPPAGDQPVSLALREALEELLMEHKVDLTLSGHHHSYQRPCHLYRAACQSRDSAAADAGWPGAPLHLVIGHGGAGLSLNVEEPPPQWLQVLGQWWGYLRLEINGTHLAGEVVADEDGAVRDTLLLSKPPGWGERFMAARQARQAQQRQQEEEQV